MSDNLTELYIYKKTFFLDRDYIIIYNWVQCKTGTGKRQLY